MWLNARDRLDWMLKGFFFVRCSRPLLALSSTQTRLIGAATPTLPSQPSY